eukprot:CAMPEP_0118952906 /NCGR_PEP_ID=MMETSP1169-20130426/55641_1 /TAXON_ID=36882 /ORGANISM="Pyramimonas obovata, Strain CCMP722" /LENGTH=48 /DNA_ID= /DNA_START= /DNA_END= /DNA_ORIENTATION=
MTYIDEEGSPGGSKQSSMRWDNDSGEGGEEAPEVKLPSRYMVLLKGSL